MIHLAENLKKLRKRASITQEQLADVLGVSPQAVSRWESETTYPDIAMLPTIANYFDVTLDELMGMDKIRDDSNLKEVLEEYRENGAKGLVAENIKLLREALKRYPNNYDLLCKLSWELYARQTSDEEHGRNTKEAIAIAERILRNCTDREIKNDVSVRLCYMYSDIGENEKAIRLAETFPSIWETSTAILYTLYTGEKQIEQAQWNVISGAELMYWALYTLSDMNCNRSGLETSDRLRIMKKALSLYELIFEEEDYLFHSERVSKIHRYIASMEMREGNREAALSHLEKSAECAVEFDTLPDTAKHTSLLVNRLEHNSTETKKNYTQSECSMLYEHVQGDYYDAIRNEERFVAVLEKMKEYI